MICVKLLKMQLFIIKLYIYSETLCCLYELLRTARKREDVSSLEHPMHIL